ncbi:MAG: ADP-ribosylglycohydrolase family protein [Anaerolineae bacterium]|nr:ADP-ribosylglycohydrolase family protein [Anaerolineae bacterium]
MGNREVLESLLAGRSIDLSRGALLDYAPGPMRKDLSFERVEGMLLGLAVGDALGNTSEGQLPDRRRARYGEIRHYLPNRHAAYRAVGLPSDDTQLAFWTLEQMLRDGGLDVEHLARRFCQEPIFGVGSAVSQFVTNWKAGQPWYQCGVRSAGNGALMRIAPVLIPHLQTGGRELWADVALAAMVTHNDAASISACLSFTHLLWQALQLPQPPSPEWWLEEYVQVARDLERGDYASNAPAHAGYRGPVWRFAEERVALAWRKGLSVLEACNWWYSGAYLLETVPSVLYILMNHGHNLEEGIIRAVNDTLDNDTIGAIVGAALGALHGKRAIPGHWLGGLLGRTGAEDDGQVFALLTEARYAWWGGH